MSLTIVTCAFTDQYGIHHPAAVCFIQSANKTESHTEAFYYDEATQEVQSSSGVHNAVSYSVGYWHDETARVGGSKTLMLNGDHLPSMTFTVDEAYDGLTLEQACLKHFQEHVLAAGAA